MFTTVHEETPNHDAPTVAEPIPSIVSTPVRKKKATSSQPAVIAKETKPLSIHRVLSQPLPLYSINQEIRDSSLIFTVQVLNAEGEANTPFIELFLPLDPDVSPEIELHTVVLRQMSRGKHTTFILEREKRKQAWPT